MNRRDLKKLDIYSMGTVVDSYGQSSYSTTKTATIEGFLVEKERYAVNDNAASLISNYFLLSDYHAFEPGQLIQDGTDKYRITSCTNSTRNSQVFLIKLKD